MANTEDNKPPAADTPPVAPEKTNPPTESSAPKSGMMEVSVDKMQEILQMVEDLTKKDQARQEEMEILRDSVSRGALEEAEGKRKVKGPPKGTLMIHNNKIVVGWKMQKNEMIYNPVNMNVPVSENLQIKLTYADGEESSSIQYVDFIRNKERASVSKIGEDGIMWIVKFDDPEYEPEDPLKIDPQFLNP